MVRINMLSSAGMTKGHGVLSAFEEQTKLVSEGLGPNYTVVINSWKKSDILHFHKPQLPAAQLVHFCGKGGVRSFSAADAGGVHPAAPADSETFVQIRFAFL